MTTTNFPYLGSVSHGTLQPIHLLGTFADVLDDLVVRSALSADEGEHPTLVRIARTRVEIIQRYGEADGGVVSDNILDQLFDALEEYAPDGYYFGAHEGDGSDFGFWAIDDDE